MKFHRKNNKRKKNYDKINSCKRKLERAKMLFDKVLNNDRRRAKNLVQFVETIKFNSKQK